MHERRQAFRIGNPSRAFYQKSPTLAATTTYATKGLKHHLPLQLEARNAVKACSARKLQILRLIMRLYVHFRFPGCRGCILYIGGMLYVIHVDATNAAGFGWLNLTEMVRLLLYWAARGAPPFKLILLLYFTVSE